MTSIPQRLREIAQMVRDPHPVDKPWISGGDVIKAIETVAAELESAPAADAVLVVAQASTAVEKRDGVEVPHLFWFAAGGRLQPGDYLVSQRDHLAAVAALQARITSLEADLAHAHHAADLNSRDAMARIEALERNQLPAGSLPINEEKLAELVKEGFMAGAEAGVKLATNAELDERGAMLKDALFLRSASRAASESAG